MWLQVHLFSWLWNVHSCVWHFKLWRYNRTTSVNPMLWANRSTWRSLLMRCFSFGSLIFTNSMGEKKSTTQKCMTVTWQCPFGSSEQPWGEKLNVYGSAGSSLTRFYFLFTLLFLSLSPLSFSSAAPQLSPPPLPHPASAVPVSAAPSPPACAGCRPAVDLAPAWPPPPDGAAPALLWSFGSDGEESQSVLMQVFSLLWLPV